MRKRENKDGESEGKEELMKKGKHGLYTATRVRQSTCEVRTII